MGKPTMWFPNWSHTDHRRRLVASSMRFWFEEEEELYYVCVAKTKALVGFVVTAKLVCAFVIAYADCWFSNEVTHVSLNKIAFLTAKNNVLDCQKACVGNQECSIYV